MSPVDPQVRLNISLAQSWLYNLGRLARAERRTRSAMIEELIARDLSRLAEKCSWKSSGNSTIRRRLRGTRRPHCA